MATAYNVWTAAEHIGALVQGTTQPIERPTQIARRALRLTRFPPCAACGHPFGICECDPDLSMAAGIRAREEAEGEALVARMNLETGRG